MANTTPFSIPFSSPYSLDEDIDFRDYYVGESLRYVRSRVISYGAGQLIIGVQGEGQKERKVRFHISQEKLQVRCNCISPGDRLCAHGYEALRDLCWNNKQFFSIFAPGNLVSIALENKNVFHINYTNPREFIAPDTSMGHLYDFEKIATTELELIPGLPVIPVPVRNTELVWLLVYSQFRWQNYLPILVPVRGTLDKDGNAIKGFGKGFENISIGNLVSTPDRQYLYQLSEAMFTSLPERYVPEPDDLLTGKKHIAENFQKWEAALPMLCEQPFVYHLRLAHPRYFMRSSPGKRYLKHITISPERPQLQFVLKDKGSYYQLSLQYLVRGVPIKSPEEDALFFVCDGMQYHLLASLRDAAMMQWMSRFENLVTVFKSRFPEFEKEILARIEAMYRVVRK